MDPLMVTGRVGEFVDLLLGDRVPVADPDLLALIGLQIGGAFQFQHRVLLGLRSFNSNTSSRQRPAFRREDGVKSGEILKMQS